MNKSAKVGQMILLALLIVGLGFMVIRMFLLINPPSAKPASSEVAAGGSSATESTTPRASGSPAVSANGTKAGAEENPVLKEQYLNPNLFRAFGIETTRNPFIQREEWYTDVLTENLPGYPELRDSGYFDSFEAYVPDIELITGEEHEWKLVDIKRNQNNQYSISGVSADGMVTTSISLVEDIPTRTGLEWSKNSGVPVSDLTDPEAAKRFQKRQVDVEGFGLGNEDFFDDQASPGGLGVPGMYPGGTGETQGDSITCSGVSLGAGRTAALLNINGFSKIVTDGSYIPPRFKVLEIKPDGVVLEEIADGSSTWIPLAGK